MIIHVVLIILFIISVIQTIRNYRTKRKFRKKAASYDGLKRISERQLQSDAGEINDLLRKQKEYQSFEIKVKLLSHKAEVKFNKLQNEYSKLKAECGLLQQHNLAMMRAIQLKPEFEIVEKK